MQTIRNRSIAALGAIVATFATVAASAPAHAETVNVSTRGLDLASPAGKSALHHRIVVAAETVCGPMNQVVKFKVYSCRQQAITNAEASIASAKNEQLALR